MGTIEERIYALLLKEIEGSPAKCNRAIDDLRNFLDAMHIRQAVLKATRVASV